MPNPKKFGLIFMLCFAFAACNPPSRMGMVRDPETGLQWGSVVEKNIVTDASLHKNKKIKVRARNTSGDPAFDLNGFTGRLYDAYRAIGYQPTESDDFGLLVDVNVMYSGQVQSNLASEFGFLGAAGGGIAGYRSQATAGTAIGALSGVTLGAILGSYVTDDTYIIVAQVSVATIRDTRRDETKTITFSRSPNPADRRSEREKEEEALGGRSLRETHATKVAVYAGGRMVPQARIAAEVRQRMVRIVSDII